MLCHIEQTLANIERFEPSISWMYLDPSGKVTVGAGILLTNAATAVRLPFQVGPRAASHREIAADFARIDALPTRQPPIFYRNPGGPELEPAVMNTLLRTALVGLEEQLREFIAGYDHLPAPARIALLDMAHTLTPAGLVTAYPALLRAVKGGAWSEAAAQSFRHGPGAARNQWTITMFRDCLPVPANEGPLKRLGYGLIGFSATVAGRIRDQT